MPKQRTREEAAAYMRAWRARKRQGKARAPSSTVDLAAIAEPAAHDPDVSTVIVRISDAQSSKLARIVRAIQARQDAPAKAPDAMRLALEVADRAMFGIG